MFRSPWELEGLTRDHAARLAAERRAVSPVGAPTGAGHGTLRRTVGMILIRAGEGLADREASPNRRAPRPATG